MSAGLSWLPKLCTVTHTAAASTQDGAEIGNSLKEDFEITTLGRFLTLNRLIKIVLAN